MLHWWRREHPVETQTETIAGRYQLIEKIGVGGAAYVYLARDTLLGRDVAVKVLTPGAAADPEFVQRFKREARAIAGLEHPNVVTVYDWGSSPEAHYMVMEYAPGGNLADYLQRAGRLDEEESLALAGGIAAGLEVAHSRGIIHRDVKPRNVLLDARGQPEVADFGAAHAAGLTQLTRTNAVVGTASYLSPEQAQGREVDERSDVYSLGVVLYEMLTGRPPFVGDSMVDVAMQHVGAAPLPPRKLRPSLSPAVEKIVLKALAKKPAGRFQSAREMRDAIERVREEIHHPESAKQSNRSVRAIAVPSPPRPARRPSSEGSGRQPWMRALLAVPLALLLGAVGVMLAMHGRPTTHLAGTRVRGTATASPRPGHHAASGHGVGRLHATPSRPSRRRSGGPRPMASPTPPPKSSVPAAQPTVIAEAPWRVPAPQPVAAAPASGPVGTGSSPGARSPSDAVIQFYALVAQHRFDAAAGLWSPSLQAAFPPSVYIDQRFQSTQSITVQRAVPAQQSGTATVYVSLTESIGPPTQTRHYAGDWQLTNSGSGWLLNWPDLQQTS